MENEMDLTPQQVEYHQRKHQITVAEAQLDMLRRIRGLLIGLVVLVAIPLVLFVLTYLTSV